MILLLAIKMQPAVTFMATIPVFVSSGSLETDLFVLTRTNARLAHILATRMPRVTTRKALSDAYVTRITLETVAGVKV